MSYERLLNPRSIAVFGGAQAQEVSRQSDRMGYQGEIWPVHPKKTEILGRPVYRSVGDLPKSPDAAYIGVNRHLTIDIVRDLAARDAGGAVCYATGFVEAGEEGFEIQRQLLEASGDMPLIGPNCYGLLNYLNGAMLWPDQPERETDVLKIRRKGSIPMESHSNKIEKAIVKKAKELGASLVGIASITDLRASVSYEIYNQKPFYEEYKAVELDEAHKSVLVWALVHPASEPVLDWWSMKVPGFTPGNRVMRMQSRKLRIWLGEELGINALSLPYQIEYGGAFLKDSAHLAGLGVIGKNNLLVTPQFGTRVRLRGIFMEAELEPTGPIDFDPCTGCDRPCHRACPRGAFRSGAFERPLCKEENDQRETDFEILDGSIMGIEEASEVVKPCRFCEFACPVAQGD